MLSQHKFQMTNAKHHRLTILLNFFFIFTMMYVLTSYKTYQITKYAIYLASNSNDFVSKVMYLFCNRQIEIEGATSAVFQYYCSLVEIAVQISFTLLPSRSAAVVADRCSTLSCSRCV